MTRTGNETDLVAATQSAIEEGILDIARLTTSQEFQSVLAELWSLPPDQRAEYVLNILLKPEQLRDRGVAVPDDLVVQRSTFRDNRPTLFCITKYLPRGLLWDKVTITFDNPEGEPALRYGDVAGTLVGGGARFPL